MMAYQVFAQSDIHGKSTKTVYVGMNREELINVYGIENLKQYEKRGNIEILAFDHLATPESNDIAVFRLINGKTVKWDKDTSAFEIDKSLVSQLRVGMSKDDVLEIYPIGNLKSYKIDGIEKIAVFDDILTSDPTDTITFYLSNDKITHWNKDAHVSNAESKEEAKKERARYSTNDSQQYDAYLKSIIGAKQGNRLGSTRSQTSYYNYGD
jgi:hypothetical protein